MYPMIFLLGYCEKIDKVYINTDLTLLWIDRNKQTLHNVVNDLCICLYDI